MRRLDGDGTTHTRCSDFFALLHTVGILVFWLYSNLLILVSIFFCVLLTGANISGFAKRDARIHSLVILFSRHHLSFAVFIAQRKEGVDFIDSHNGNEFKFSYLSAQRDSTGKSYHYGIEFHIAFPSFLLIVPAAAMNENRRRFSGLHSRSFSCFARQCCALNVSLDSHNGNLIVLSTLCAFYCLKTCFSAVAQLWHCI